MNAEVVSLCIIANIGAVLPVGYFGSCWMAAAAWATFFITPESDKIFTDSNSKIDQNTSNFQNKPRNSEFFELNAKFDNFMKIMDTREIFSNFHRISKIP